ncbi:hypothetical protein ADUPG1_013556 [Aduncisulcus paluster]|uniref:Uncharacterized protein n=1 Tax=Aduncisulcus paluster TaxID=2918883 RepID=A0ABQ5K7E5_9EUKA|nr:hypothetical protein ADUPG1_013556 [Aduncisulcus paluster]
MTLDDSTNSVELSVSASETLFVDGSISTETKVITPVVYFTNSNSSATVSIDDTKGLYLEDNNLYVNGTITSTGAISGDSLSGSTINIDSAALSYSSASSTLESTVPMTIVDKLVIADSSDILPAATLTLIDGGVDHTEAVLQSDATLYFENPADSDYYSTWITDESVTAKDLYIQKTTFDGESYVYMKDLVSGGVWNYESISSSDGTDRFDPATLKYNGVNDGFMASSKFVSILSTIGERKTLLALGLIDTIDYATHIGNGVTSEDLTLNAAQKDGGWRIKSADTHLEVDYVVLLGNHLDDAKTVNEETGGTTIGVMDLNGVGLKYGSAVAVSQIFVKSGKTPFTSTSTWTSGTYSEEIQSVTESSFVSLFCLTNTENYLGTIKNGLLFQEETDTPDITFLYFGERMLDIDLSDALNEFEYLGQAGIGSYFGKFLVLRLGLYATIMSNQSEFRALEHTGLDMEDIIVYNVDFFELGLSRLIFGSYMSVQETPNFDDSYSMMFVADGLYDSSGTDIKMLHTIGNTLFEGRIGIGYDSDYGSTYSSDIKHFIGSESVSKTGVESNLLQIETNGVQLTRRESTVPAMLGIDVVQFPTSPSPEYPCDSLSDSPNVDASLYCQYTGQSFYATTKESGVHYLQLCTCFVLDNGNTTIFGVGEIMDMVGDGTSEVVAAELTEISDP